MSIKIPEFLSAAAAQPTTLPIRDLLQTWGFRARTFENVARVTSDLSAAGLACSPDLASGELSSVVTVGPVHGTSVNGVGEPPPPAGVGSVAEPVSGARNEEQALELPTFTLLVRDIPAAEGGITKVNPNQTLAEAKYLMASNDYSQLPVLSGSRSLKGVVSWRSIAKAELNKPNIGLMDAIDPYPKVVFSSQSLLEQIPTINEAGFVLVRGTDQTITGIVTATDLVTQLSDLTTPFFQLGDIETKLRRCISRVFTDMEEVCTAVDDVELTSVSAMTFGQYITLLGTPDRWERMHWPSVPRQLFIHQLDEVREIRNRVMHFGVQLSSKDRTRLTAFLGTMDGLDKP